MNATTAVAATQANVTVATIRTWCRHGVVAAIKQAGRWIIDTASLAARIAISAWKRPTRQETSRMINLAATYTYTSWVGDEQVPVTLTPKVSRRDRDGDMTITVSRLAPLFADRFDAITDEGDRIHCLELFRTARIVIASTPDEDSDDDPQAREGGRLRTTYRGTVPGITVNDVLDLAARLRDQLA